MSKTYRNSAPALAVLLIWQQAQAFDVHGIHIGDRWDPARLEEAMSYLTVPIPQRVKCRLDGAESCDGATRYLVADVRLIIEGKNGRVTKISMTLPAGDFDEEITALKREFGQPTEEWSAAPAGPAPLPFRRRVDWRGPAEELFALKFSSMAIISVTTPQESAANRYPPPS
jgi:hypothetical protein